MTTSSINKAIVNEIEFMSTWSGKSVESVNAVYVSYYNAPSTDLNAKKWGLDHLLRAHESLRISRLVCDYWRDNKK